MLSRSFLNRMKKTVHLKKWMNRRRVAFLLAGTLLTGCGDPVGRLEKSLGITEPDYPEPKPSLPLDRTLTNESGKTLEVTVIGRDADSVTIIRKADGMRFVYSINSLSKKDRDFANSLPLTPAPEKGASGSREKDPYVARREDRIKELEKRRKSLGSSFLKAEGSQKKELERAMKDGTLLKEAKRLESEIEELRQSIEDYKWMHKIK